jgi:hypothetical protein
MLFLRHRSIDRALLLLCGLIALIGGTALASGGASEPLGHQRDFDRRQQDDLVGKLICKLTRQLCYTSFNDRFSGHRNCGVGGAEEGVEIDA